MSAQSSQSVSSQSVPRLINVSGVFRPADGQPAAPSRPSRSSIYADAGGRRAAVAGNADHRRSMARAATRCCSARRRPTAFPPRCSASGDAQWLGTVFERAGEVEGPRVRITSVPYALRASDADTLGGRPASAYLLAPDATAAPRPTRSGRGGNDAGAGTSPPTARCWPGTPNFSPST